MSGQWLEKLRRNEHELSRAERSLIAYVNRRPEQAARLNQQELAGQAGVSKPVIINCFRRLGYKSFREFQSNLEQFFSTQINSLSATRNVLERVGSVSALTVEAASVDARALQRLHESLDPKTLELVSRRLHDARSVLVMGQSTGHYAAHYVATRLPRYGLPTILVSQDERHVAEALHTATAGDVLLLFHYSDDDTWLYRVSEIVAARGSWTTLVSATIHPDYVDGVDLFIHVPRGEIGFKNSMAVPMHFANLLLLSYEVLYRDEVDTHLTTLEDTRRLLKETTVKKLNGKE
ncbi:MAG: MurR/RpiR family transcriptional regulator [Spirochaetaceae bacterium]